jgi:protein involved in sex pheromone biosynthesis
MAMKRWMTLGCLAVACVVLLAGCGDACDDLEERCESCEPQQALNCAVVISEEDADACQLLLDDAAFQAACP